MKEVLHLIMHNSESHDLESTINGTHATLSNKVDSPREFLLIIELNEPHKEPSAVVEVWEPASQKKAAGKSSTVMVSYYPGYV